MGSVSVVDGGTAFKTYAVVVGVVEVAGGFKVLNLLNCETADAVAVELDEAVGGSSSSLDACAADEVGLSGEILLIEVFVASPHQACVVGIDVLDVDPCAMAVCFECAVLLVELLCELFKELNALCLGVALACCTCAAPVVFVGAMAVLSQSRGEDLSAHLALHVDPEADFTAIEWGLLDDANNAECVGELVEDGGFLVGSIAHKDAAGDGLAANGVFLAACVGGEQALELLWEALAFSFDVDGEHDFMHGVEALPSGAVGGDFYPAVEVVKVSEFEIH